MKRRQAGLTLIELLVVMALGLVVLTIAFDLFNGANKLVETDTGRVMATQNVQTAVDLLANDIRQAGENLELSKPKLGASGLEFGAAQTVAGVTSPAYVTIRRNVPADPVTKVQILRLPVCAKVGNKIQVAGPKAPAVLATGACAASDINVAPWRNYLDSQGRAQAALLYCGACGTGGTRKVTRVAVTAVEQPVIVSGVQRISVVLRDPVPTEFPDDTSILMLVDERRYFLGTDQTLRLALGGQTDAQAEPVAFNVTALNVTADLIATDTADAQSAVGAIGLTGPWERIKQVNLSLTGGNAGQGRLRSRTFEARIFPRNIESARGNP